MSDLAALQPPILSALDPVEVGEGSVDPLLLEKVYEHLAERILPSLTVRMQRVRFLTAVAAGAKVCECFDPDEMAADGVTPPWLVYEWYVAEALVRLSAELGGTYGLPGRLKIEAAWRDDRSISTRTYLKTAKIFGFTGIYKTLGVGLGVVTDDLQLDEGGDELLAAWEKDQGLDGFRAGASGAGAKLREDLRRVVRKGLAAGHTEKLPGELYGRIGRSFWPDKSGTAERRALRTRLGRVDREDGADPASVHVRREIVERVEKRGRRVGGDEEPETNFLRSLADGAASSDLAERLGAIDAYEGLCRPMTQAFALVRHAGTRERWVRLGDVGATAEAQKLAARVERAARRVAECEALLAWEKEDVAPLAAQFLDLKDGRALVDAVVQRHEESQKKKPPDGKRSWLERAPDGRFLVRPAYAVSQAPEDRADYVHVYRVPTVSRFLVDLGRVKT